MTDDNTCHRCGEPADLHAADQNGVFRPVCQDCFEEHHSSRSPPDWRDGAVLAGVVAVAFGADIAVLSTETALSIVLLGIVAWLALTTVSGAYPWSLRRL